MIKSESGRWYSINPVQCQLEIVGKNGKSRKPTIKDARENDWIPSVTTKMSVKAKPGLEQWKQRQVLLSALTLPRLNKESDEDFVDRVLADADELASIAAETGKDFHSAFEQFWKQGLIENEDKAINTALLNLMDWKGKIEQKYKGLIWTAESPYYNKELDCCGTPDLVGISSDTLIVVDYKTLDLAKFKTPYDEHAMQIACGIFSLYGSMQPKYWFGIELYVDRTSGEIKVHEWNRDDVQRGWEMFKCVSKLWDLVNKWERNS
jgi:hypothetical protein